MSDIKRYSPEPLYLSGDYTAQMSEEPDGDYVDFDDYERLRAERDAAVARYRHVIEILRRDGYWAALMDDAEIDAQVDAARGGA